MDNLVQLRTHRDDGSLRCVIETPAKSRVKIAYDPTEGVFVYARPLQLGLSYPYDWGFIPSTRAPDGDPLDVMVFHDGATAPGVVIPCTAIGAVRVSQKEKGKSREENDRIIAAPVADDRCSDARDLNSRQRKELENFFVALAMLTAKQVRVEGWSGPKMARKLIAQAQKAYDHGPDTSEEKK